MTSRRRAERTARRARAKIHDTWRRDARPSPLDAKPEIAAADDSRSSATASERASERRSIAADLTREISRRDPRLKRPARNDPWGPGEPVLRLLLLSSRCPRHRRTSPLLSRSSCSPLSLSLSLSLAFFSFLVPSLSLSLSCFFCFSP